jgi:hypothetical protein
MNVVWIKRLLLVAAAWNVVGGVSSLLDPAQHIAQMYSTSLSLEDPLQLYFYRGEQYQSVRKVFPEFARRWCNQSTEHLRFPWLIGC